MTGWWYEVWAGTVATLALLGLLSAVAVWRKGKR